MVNKLRADLAAEKALAEKAEAELYKLRHAVWHALDDCEVLLHEITISEEHFDALCKLVPEDHPIKRLDAQEGEG